MKILSQRDLQWSQVKLGISSLTVGRFGCTTTALSMASDYFKCYSSPGIIAQNNNNYTGQGLIIWKNLNFPCFKFFKREYGKNDIGITIALKDPNQIVLLQVQDGAHWVLGYSKLLLGSYKIADPWFGDICLASRYKNITGAAYFKRV